MLHVKAWRLSVAVEECSIVALGRHVCSENCSFPDGVLQLGVIMSGSLGVGFLGALIGGNKMVKQRTLCTKRSCSDSCGEHRGSTGGHTDCLGSGEDRCDDSRRG